MATQPKMGVIGTRQPTVLGAINPKGLQQIASATLASATALTVPTGAILALIQAQDQNIRWTDDSTKTVSSTVGMILYAGDSMWYSGDLSALRFIYVTSGADLNVSYYSF